MCTKISKTGVVSVLLALIIVLVSPFIKSAQAQEAAKATQASPEKTRPASLGILTGKTVWVVDINSNEYYNAALQAALVDQIPVYAPGAIVRHVITSEKGNPFFLLRKENYPDAAIISLGVCKGTAKVVANYASEAKKKGIPSVMCFIGDVRDEQMNWNKTYRNPDGAAIEIEKIPQSQQEAMPIAEWLVPIIVEKLKH